MSWNYENCIKVIDLGCYSIFKILSLGERASICAIKQLHCFHLYFWYMCVLRLPESGGHERAGWVLGPSLKSALTFSCTPLRKNSTNVYLEYNSAWKQSDIWRSLRCPGAEDLQGSLERGGLTIDFLLFTLSWKGKHLKNYLHCPVLTEVSTGCFC